MYIDGFGRCYLSKKYFPRLIARAGLAAERLGSPRFYEDHWREMRASAEILESSPVIERCRAQLDETEMHPAHGVEHCEKVALDAGAILLVECARQGIKGTLPEELTECVQIAGLLHDIKRNEQDHSIAGSIEAKRILSDFDIDQRLKDYVTLAIRNHEAFKRFTDPDDNEAKLVSNSLYDADKFRWGPDNFTSTLWLIMESTATPIEHLYEVFEQKMGWIRNIKMTFRSDTGREFGPEFIDMGLKIGNEIFGELKDLLGVHNASDN